MLNVSMVRRALERVEGAFQTYEEGLTSELVLTVTIRSQADGLRGVLPNAAIALAGLADDIDASKGRQKPKQVIRDLHRRFEAWQEDTLAIVEAESSREREVARAEEAAEREEFLARAGVGSASSQVAAAPPPSPAEDEALVAAQAEVEGLEATGTSTGVDDESAAMTIEEIERILQATRE